MIGVWRDGGGDTDAGPGARAGGSRAGAGPSELARQHDVPAAPVAAGVGARADLRAVAGALLRRRAPRRAHGRRRQGVRRHAAGRHAHRRPSRAEGVPRPRGPPGRPEDLHARPDAGGQGAGRGAPGDAPARHGGRPGADVGPRPAARRHRSRGARRRGVERVRRDGEAGPQPEGQVTTGRVLSAASAWALAAAALLLTGCSDSAAGKPARNAAPPAVPVTAADAVEKTVPIQLTAVGNAMAYTTVGIKSQVNGQIVQVHFKEGQDVRQNDLLFTIDPRPFEAALRQAEAALRQRQAEVQQAIANVERDTAQLANARVQERRYKALVEKELVAREQYDQLQTNLAAMEATVQADRAAVENAKASERAAQANVDNARLQLGYTEIRAPIDGRTGNLLVQNGNVIKANDDNPLVVVVNPDATGESRPVAPGTRLGAETIIEQGLRAGERVVTDGQLRLVPGAKVEIRPPKTS